MRSRIVDVFISYKKEDSSVAERVVHALRATGLAVWWDENLTARSSWDAEIESQIASAASVVVLWTTRSVESEWVRTEAHYGLEHGKLIPVMMDPCKVPLEFVLRQSVNLSDWQGEADHKHWRKLLAWIDDLVQKPADVNAAQSGDAAAAKTSRTVVGHLPSGQPIVDGTFVRASTPAGTAFRDADLFPVVRVVPSGAFFLGSSASDPDRSVVEGPQKRVEIPVPFAIGVFPVLVCEYAAVSDTVAPKTLSSVPVTNVSFQDANAFLKKLQAKSGEMYRLPSEAEWEYACRAGSRSRYSFGDALDKTMAVFDRRDGPVAPGSCPANAFGLYDMHGNVREWTADLWHESYDSTPVDGSPALEGHGSMRVVRGGGWSDTAVMLRSAARMRATESFRSNVIGLRVIRVLA